MDITKIALLFAVLSASAWTQTGYTASFSTDGQPTIRLESKLEPEKPGPLQGFNNGTASRNKTFQRYFNDRATHDYFGYSLALEKVSSSEYRITVGPIRLNPAEHPIADSLARLTQLKVFPPPQVVRFGDRVAIEFFENPKTGQKIVDYLWLEPPNCEGEVEKADCLTVLIADADGELEHKLQALDARQDLSGQQTFRQSQQTWQVYRNEACQAWEERPRQLDCQLKLTRSRIHDLGAIY